MVKFPTLQSPHGASCLETMTYLVLLKYTVSRLYVVLISQPYKKARQNGGPLNMSEKFNFRGKIFRI